MKIKLLEHYRDAQNVLAQGDEAEVSQKLGQWLIENGKAALIEEPKVEPKKKAVKHETLDDNLAD
jgi:hypothetical protein